MYYTNIYILVSPTKEQVILPTNRPPRLEKHSALHSTAGADASSPSSFSNSSKRVPRLGLLRQLSRANAGPVIRLGDRLKRGFGAQATTLPIG